MRVIELNELSYDLRTGLEYEDLQQKHTTISELNGFFLCLSLLGKRRKGCDNPGHGTDPFETKTLADPD
jgi:hypothetical protein